MSNKKSNKKTTKTDKTKSQTTSKVETKKVIEKENVKKVEKQETKKITVKEQRTNEAKRCREFDTFCFCSLWCKFTCRHKAMKTKRVDLSTFCAVQFFARAPPARCGENRATRCGCRA